MDFYEQIKNMSDEEIKAYLDELIPELEEESKKINGNVFGFEIEYNQDKSKLEYLKDQAAYHINLHYLYSGYMPKNTKVIYGIHTERHIITNNGMFYTLDDDKYIYAFCKYIKEIDVIDEEDLFDYLLIFLNAYYGSGKKGNRDEMFKLICKDEKTYMEPIVEHKFSSFKGKGNAMCSEYAIMASNILNVFGFYGSTIIGQLKKGSREAECHTFNIIEYVNDEGKQVSFLVDFAVGVDVFNIDYKKIGESPYVLELENIEDMPLDFHITGKDYFNAAFGRSILPCATEEDRDYFTCNNIVINKPRQK